MHIDDIDAVEAACIWEYRDFCGIDDWPTDGMEGWYHCKNGLLMAYIDKTTDPKLRSGTRVICTADGMVDIFEHVMYCKKREDLLKAITEAVSWFIIGEGSVLDLPTTIMDLYALHIKLTGQPTPITQHVDPYRQGMEAYWDDVKRSDNPYGDNTEEAESWDEGWVKSSKQ